MCALLTDTINQCWWTEAGRGHRCVQIRVCVCFVMMLAVTRNSDQVNSTSLLYFNNSRMNWNRFISELTEPLMRADRLFISCRCVSDRSVCSLDIVVISRWLRFDGSHFHRYDRNGSAPSDLNTLIQVRVCVCVCPVCVCVCVCCVCVCVCVCVAQLWLNENMPLPTGDQQCQLEATFGPRPFALWVGLVLNQLWTGLDCFPHWRDLQRISDSCLRLAFLSHWASVTPHNVLFCQLWQNRRSHALGRFSSALTVAERLQGLDVTV